MMSSTQAIDDPSHKPLIQIIDPVDPEECATVNVEEDDSGNIQNKTTTSPCLMCGSSDGSISAFARIGINGDDTEPLISVLSSILNKAVVDIPLHTEVVCTKCFKKFEAILKLQNKLVEICRDVIHSFNKAVTKFVKTLTEHSLHAHHMEGNALSQVNDTGIIISPVDGGEELVSLTPLTVTEGVNMVVAVDPSNRTLEIPVVQAESGATSLLPTSTLISETSTVLTECLGNGTTNLVSNAGVTSGELTEIASESGIVSGEVVGQATIEHTINADDTVTILNPSTIFKISDWGIH
ncbi:hypothetical protein C7M84_001657 [Penaeus vannamei]|uniref:ZAD domain-containing protein n=1 Tax=Penaeus vannamei TaxID=6689 RepID=A0A3R7PWV7_PENVA|nr:hypothetical protein C7M84_001657 [Penaeus vannamei]